MLPKSILWLITCSAALVVLPFAANAGDMKRSKTDANGDALPADARMRMGSVRWRHGEPITFLASPPNEKTLITASTGATLLVWDRATGKLIRRLIPPDVEPTNTTNQTRRTFAAMSPDGKQIAVVLANDSIAFWDLETAKIVRKIQGPKNAGPLSYSPDGKMIAAGSALLDIATQNELRKFTSGNFAKGIAFSPDSKVMATPDSSTALSLFEATSGKRIRQIDLITSSINCCAFSPDGKWLAYNGGYMVHVSNAVTGKDVKSFHSDQGAFSMLFSPDSKSLAIRGADNAVRLFEAATGKHLHTLGETVSRQHFHLTNDAFDHEKDILFSRDGKMIVVGRDLTPRFFDVGNGEEHSLPGDGHRGRVTALAVSPDGKTLISRGEDRFVRVWNNITGTEIRSLAERKDTTITAFSPDAKFVAFGNTLGIVYLIDVASGTEKWQVKCHKGGVASLVFSADGKMLASRGALDSIIRNSDVQTGNEIKELTIEIAKPDVGFRYEFGPDAREKALAYSADGRFLATPVAPPRDIRNREQTQPHSLQFWNVSTGKSSRKIELSAGRAAHSIVYSHDSRLMLCEYTDKTIGIWELASGRERAHWGAQSRRRGVDLYSSNYRGDLYGLPAATQLGPTIAISPDGRLLASQGENHSIRIWDLLLAKQVGSFTGQNGDVASLVFAPDGKSLISGSADATIVVWDITRLKQPAVAELKTSQFDALWSDLRSEDAVVAGKAVAKLTLASKPAVTFLQSRLQPAVGTEAKQIDQWVRDLDSAKFATRIQALNSLEKVGEPAIPALEKALTMQPSLETRRRVQPLLEKLRSGTLSAEQLRIVRAIESLENIATQDARQLLEQLAKGDAGALTTQEARTALARIASVRKQSMR